ncbi:MAG: diaminohydroxyphosphoribosylaminopyrimidine deaminase [Cellvibrionaceae bacterium]|jgi:diaminohydroxyphosphoribosylaminopyrimidine deaminase/5-amino-6-(5-phosphoribosylamino)uracil reductase
MSLALQLAERGRYTAKPNPCVGCVIVIDNRLLGEGWHHQAGTAHAEANALTDAGSKTKGATAYVTLEPCNHQGRTGPCTHALIKAGIHRVVFAMQDPNPLVAGQGVSVLKSAGIIVDGPILESQARAVNPGFISRMERKRPWLRCKIAMSMDGRTAMASGESQWITGASARSDGQRWRARSGAIVTGIDSVLHDNSRLTLRKKELALNEAFVDVETVLALAPVRVVLDTRLRIPEDAAILDRSSRTLLLTSSAELELQPEKVKVLESLGSHISIEAIDVSKDGRLCLASLLTLLAEKECNEVLLEAGATLLGSFLKAGLIDEFIIYQAPVLLGSTARPMLTLPLELMAEKKRLHIIDQRKMGDDQRIIARIE